jgi:hypothetical protein
MNANYLYCKCQRKNNNSDIISDIICKQCGKFIPPHISNKKYRPIEDVQYQCNEPLFLWEEKPSLLDRIKGIPGFIKEIYAFLIVGCGVIILLIDYIKSLIWFFHAPGGFNIAIMGTVILTICLICLPFWDVYSVVSILILLLFWNLGFCAQYAVVGLSLILIGKLILYIQDR